MGNFLMPDRIRHEYGLEIKEKLIPDGSKLKPNRKLTSGKAEYITIIPIRQFAQGRMRS